MHYAARVGIDDQVDGQRESKLVSTTRGDPSELAQAHFIFHHFIE